MTLLARDAIASRECPSVKMPQQIEVMEFGLWRLSLYTNNFGGWAVVARR